MNTFAKYVKWGQRPAIEWKEYQNRFATGEELSAWDASSYNLGVVCGRLSQVIVLDVDSPEAQEFVSKLGLPRTPIAVTPRGKHFYFAYPAVEIRNEVRVAGLKLDVRGEGGFVVAPPSQHESGAFYEWEVSPDDAPFAPVPENLLALLKLGSSQELQTASRRAEFIGLIPSNRFGEFLQNQLNEALGELRSAPNGERNDTLVPGH